MFCGLFHIILVFISLWLFSLGQENPGLIRSTMEWYRRGSQELRLELSDNKSMLSEYDFIIIGAGTAGCALAARLAENKKWKILLIEAGQHENLMMDVPLLVHYLQLGPIDWKYRTEPSENACLAMNNNRCNWPRGKVMGGSSVLNFMMYTRGNRLDYDNWANLGNTGWSYNDILPYFKKLEDSSVPDADKDYVGRGGPVTVSYVTWKSDIAKAFVKAGIEDGLNYVDYNGRNQIGVSFLQTTTRNATRTSSNRAYLYPIKGRPNLHIQKYSHVTKILINEKTKTAYGVTLYKNGKYHTIHAKREIISSAGAINTPQLLMLSGIGPKQHLDKIGIKTIIDLPVGENLMDHTAPAITFTTNVSSLHFDIFMQPSFLREMIRYRGPYGSPGGCEAISFYDIDPPNKPDGWPDIELFLVGGSITASPVMSRAFGIKRSIYDKMFSDMERNDLDAFMIFPMILRPKSRGRILLKNKNPFIHPLIYSNYYDDPYDLNITVRGIMKAVDLIKMPSFKAINAKLWDHMLPKCSKYGFSTEKYWECYARHFTLTIYHYSGTCKMGPKNDPTSVVDPRLRIKGIKNLRVVDASIIPVIMSGHPNGPVFMIAEKAADMIKQDHGFIT